MVSRSPINVLIVEDSAALRLLLFHILDSDPDINVIGTAGNGDEAISFLQEKKPDVVVMDINMPGRNGFEVTRQIMETNPVPVIICSASFDPAEVSMTFKALEAGALALVAKPVGPTHDDYEETASRLLETVKLMSEVKVVKRWPAGHRQSIESTSATPADMPRQSERRPAGSRNQRPEVLAIGASTGGPAVIQTILAGMPRDLPIPVVVVQHIATGFLSGLVDWLVQSTGFPSVIATQGTLIQPGHAYFAPDDRHMEISPEKTIRLTSKQPDNGHRPSVSCLFRSINQVYGGASIAVLLTGMGRDGADELALLRTCGATTIAQDKATSIVHGMPGEAIQLGAATHVLRPEEIPPLVARLLAETS